MSAHTLFTATNGNGSELWSSDGIENVLLATQLTSKSVDFAGAVYFALMDGIYKTDGTPEGTHLVAAAGSPRSLVAGSSKLYFIATPAVPPEADPAFPPLGGGAPVNSPQLFELFQDSARQITSASTSPGPGITGIVSIDNVVVAGNHVYFGAMTQFGGYQVEHWDGAVGGPIMDANGYAGQWNTLTFRATESGDLYATGGMTYGLLAVSPAGMYEVSGTGVDYMNADFANGVVANGAFYFLAYAQDYSFPTASSYDLFYMNSPGAPAMRVRLPAPPMDPSAPYMPDYVGVGGLTAIGDTVFYTRFGGAGMDLFRVVPGGEQQLTGGTTGIRWDATNQVAVDHGAIYFMARSTGVDPQLFRSDGGPAVIVGGFGSHMQTYASQLQVASIGSTIYLTLGMSDGDHLFRIDGPYSEPQVVSGAVSELRDLQASNGRLLFTSKVSGNASQLWVSDGTPEGTHVVMHDASGIPIFPQGNFITLGSSVSGPDTTPPFVLPPQDFSYTENQESGSTVALVQASDNVAVTDFRFAGTGTSEDPSGQFHISTSGRITLTPQGWAGDANDYERVLEPFDLLVQAGDAAGNWSPSAHVRLTVENVDEYPPVVPAPTWLDYQEGTLAGAVLGTLNINEGQIVLGWRFVDSGTDTSADGFFRVSVDGKVMLTVAGAALADDFESWPTEFRYQVQATDLVGQWSEAASLTLEMHNGPDPVPAPEGTAPRALYTVTNARNIQELWATNGTTAVKLHDAIVSAPQVLDGTIWFTAADGLWKTDGTLQGTHQVGVFSAAQLFNTPPLVSDGAGGVYLVSDQLYHVAADGTTTRLTPPVQDVFDPMLPYTGLHQAGFMSINGVAALGDKTYFVGNYREFGNPSVGGGSYEATSLYVLDEGGGYHPIDLFTQLPPFTGFLPSGEHALYLATSDVLTGGYQMGTTRLWGLDEFGLHDLSYAFSGLTSSITSWRVVGNEVFVATNTGMYRMEPQGAVYVDGVPPPLDPGSMPPQINPATLTVVGDTLYYLQSPDGFFFHELRSVSGKGGSTVVPLEDRIVYPSALAAADGKLYVLGYEPTNGTPTLFELQEGGNGPQFVARLPDAGTFVGETMAVAARGGALYVTLSDQGEAVYRIDLPSGTATRLDGAGALHEASQPILVGDHVVFSGKDVEHGTELWTSDGTEAGTHLLSDAAPGENTRAGIQFSRGTGNPAGGLVFETFEQYQDLHSLWQVDAGGSQAYRVSFPDGWTFRQYFEDGDGVSFFSASHSADEVALFKRDAQGVSMVADGDFWPQRATVTGGEMLFGSIEPGDNVLKVTGPQGVSTVHTSTGEALAYDSRFSARDGYFLATAPGSAEQQLFRLDGDVATQMTHLVGGFGFASLPEIAETPTGVVFQVGLTQFGQPAGLYELAAGTLTRLDAVTSGPRDISVVGSAVYFMTGSRLWVREDGHVSQVTAANGSPLSVSDIQVVGDALYANAAPTTGNLTRGIYRIAGDFLEKVPGATLTTSLAGGLLAAGDNLYFRNDFGLNAIHPDGSISALPGLNYNDQGNYKVAGNILYYTGSDSQNGQELWRTDGTVAGTFRVTDTRAPNSSSPANFMVIDAPLDAGDETPPVVTEGQSFTHSANASSLDVFAVVAATDTEGVTGFRFADTLSTLSADRFFRIGADGSIRHSEIGNPRPGGGNLTYAVQAGDAAGNWSEGVAVHLHLTQEPVVLSLMEFSHAENLPEGAVLGRVVASDDGVVTGFRFTDSQGELSLDGRLRIDATGHISLTAAGAASGLNDYEAQPDAIAVSVQAGDDEGFWSYPVNVRLQTTNVEDEAPVVAGGQSFTYTEGARAGVVLGSVAASDDTAVSAWRFADSQAAISADGFYRIDAEGQLSLTPAGAASTAANDFETGLQDLQYAVEAGDAVGHWSAATPVQLHVADGADPAPGPDASHARALFTVTNAAGVQELWSTDGTHSAKLHEGITQPAQRFDGVILFTAVDGIWTTDGTTAGTCMVSPLVSSRPLVADGSGGFYVVADQIHHVVNGVATQLTHGVAEITDLGVADGHVYFIGRAGPGLETQLNELGVGPIGVLPQGAHFLPSAGNTLYITDGFDSGRIGNALYAVNGSYMTSDLAQAMGNFPLASANWLVAGDQVFLASFSGVYRMDPMGPVSVDTGAPVIYGVPPTTDMAGHPVVVGSSLYYLYTTTPSGPPFGPQVELRTVSGQGLAMVVAGSENIASPDALAVAGDKLYVLGRDPATQDTALFSLEAGGPQLVAALPGVPLFGNFLEIAAHGNAVYLTVNGGTHQLMYRLDPTTHTATAIGTGSNPSASTHLTVVGDTLVFSGGEAVHGTELWAADGAGGTHLLQDIAAGQDRGSSTNYWGGTGDDGALTFISAAPLEQDSSIWHVGTDGQGATRVASPAGWTLRYTVAASGDIAYAIGRDAADHSALVKIDANGATVIATLGYSSPSTGTVIDGRLLFGSTSEVDGVHRVQVTDALGVSVVHTNGGGTLRDPGAISATGGYFLATLEGGSTQQLYQWNGSVAVPLTNTAAGLPGDTYLSQVVATSTGAAVSTVTQTGSAIYQFAGGVLTTLYSGPQLYTPNLSVVGSTVYWANDTDAFTFNGTQVVQLTHSAIDGHRVDDLQAVGGELFMTAEDAAGARHLYKLAGSTFVPDLATEGIGYYGPHQHLFAAGSNLYFRDTDGALRVRHADGTVAGVGAALHATGEFKVSGKVLYFTADDHTGDGTELWRTDGTQAGTFRVTDTRFALDSSPDHFLVIDASNHAPTGSVWIEGAQQSEDGVVTPIEGDLLLASNSLADLDGGTGTISYQWLRNGLAIDGAIDSAYQLTQQDVASVISVRASFTDGVGHFEFVDSNPTDRVLNYDEQPTGDVSLIGTPREDEVLTVESTLVDPDGAIIEVSYIWSRGDEVNHEATGTTYTLTQADVGKSIRVVVLPIDVFGGMGFGYAETELVANVNDAPAGSVSITGTVRQGEELLASNNLVDEDGLGDISYQWLRDGNPIEGATSASHVLTQDDVGAFVSVAASYTDGYLEDERVISASTARVENINDAPTGELSIIGVARQGEVLTAASTLADADGIGVLAYQWLRNGEAVVGATEASYVLRQEDVGAAMGLEASYTDAYLHHEAVRAAATPAVENVNDAPEGAPTAQHSTAEDTPYVVSSVQLLQGFTDADGDTLTVRELQAVQGTVTPNADGTWTITPAQDFNGVMALTYVVDDGSQGSVAASSTLMVTAVNDAPANTVPGPELIQLLPEDASRTFTIGYGNGITVADVDGGVLTTTLSVPIGIVWAVTGAGATITNNYTCSVTIQGTAAQINAALDGLGYTAPPDFNGSLVLTLSTTDGTLVDTDTVDLIVQAQQDIVSDALATSEDTPITANLITGTNGASADNFESPSRAISSVTQGANGSVTFAQDGSVTYRPDADFNGIDAFTYTVTSAGTTETATVNVTVTGVNDAPVNRVPGPEVIQWFMEETTRQFAFFNGIDNTITVADVDGGVLTTTVSVAAGGTLTAMTAGGATIINNDSASVTVQGTAAQINAALYGLRYTAVADFNGDVALTVSTSDGTLVDVDTVDLYVMPDADIQGDTLATAEDTAITANLVTGTNGATADNFENAGRAISSVTQGAHGAVSFATDGEVTYTPDADYDDIDSFTYTVTSGGVTETATVSVSIAGVNDAPVSAPVVLSATPEDTARLITQADLLAGASDLEHDPLTARGLQVSSGGGSLVDNGDGTWTYTPAANFNGPVGFSYTVTDQGTSHGAPDPRSTTAVASLAVTAVNDAPVSGAVMLTPGIEDTPRLITRAELLANATDIEGDFLTVHDVSVTSGAGSITDNGNDTWTFTPNANAYGSFTLAYTITDAGTTNGASDPRSVAASATLPVTPVYDAPTGDVVIRGLARQGELLTADSHVEDGDGMGALSYQWLRDGAAISGATGSQYLLTQADVGFTVEAAVSYTDGLGILESVTSHAGLTVQNVNDAPTGAVTISGPARQGEVLAASNSLADADGMGTIGYQWLRNGVAVSGATSATYTLGQADVAKAITVAASYTDGFGTQETIASAPSAPVQNVNDAPTGQVLVTGLAQQGQTLSASNTLADLDGMGAVGYQWLRDGMAVAGATGSSYVLDQADVGRAISVAASYSDGYGTSERVTSSATSAVANVNDAPTGSVLIAGLAQQGGVLNASNSLADADGMGAVSYQWLRGGVAVAGATGSSYTLVQADVGAAITVAASYIDAFGAAERVVSAATLPVANVNDAPNGAVTITGTAVQRSLLTATNSLQDLDGMGPVSYQWLREGNAINGATSGSYSLVQADVGKSISVAANYTDGFGAAEHAVSAGTPLVANVNDIPTGALTISGIARQGVTLSAVNGLSDADGLGVLSYQWLRGGVAITGATGASYVLGQVDVGKSIQLSASYTDGFGTVERVVSPVTSLVQNVNDAPEVLAPIPSQIAKEDSAFSYRLDSSAIFTDLDKDPLALSIANLPSWLKFTAASLTLSGTPRDGAAGAVDLVVKATDPSGASAQAILHIVVADNPGESWTGSKNGDVHRGTGGQDTLVGADGNDYIDGGAGSDWITGGKGSDTIATGAGWDTLVFGRGSGKDTVTDFKLGIDRLLLVDNAQIASVTQVDTNNDGLKDATLVDFVAGGDQLTLLGVVGATAAQLLNPLP